MKSFSDAIKQQKDRQLKFFAVLKIPQIPATIIVWTPEKMCRFRLVNNKQTMNRTLMNSLSLRKREVQMSTPRI